MTFCRRTSGCRKPVYTKIVYLASLKMTRIHLWGEDGHVVNVWCYVFIYLIVVYAIHLYDGGRYINVGGNRRSGGKRATFAELYQLNSLIYDWCHIDKSHVICNGLQAKSRHTCEATWRAPPTTYCEQGPEPWKQRIMKIPWPSMVLNLRSYSLRSTG